MSYLLVFIFIFYYYFDRSSFLSTNSYLYLSHGHLCDKHVSLNIIEYRQNQNQSLVNICCSFSKDFMTDRQLFETGDNVFQDYIATCKLTTLTYNPVHVYNQHSTVTRDFAVDVCNLPTNEDPSNIDEYFQFLDTWGTVKWFFA